MSLPENTNQSDYDQRLLAEKYIKTKDLSDDNSIDRHLLIRIFDADNITSLVKHGLDYLNYNIPVECALDVGCGEGNIFRVLIKEKLAKYVVGIDKSTHMINYAKVKSNDDSTYYKYILANAITDDFPTVLGKKFPLIVQTYMLYHAKDIDQLSRMISNIAQVSCGIFVGLIPSPYCDYSSDSVKKLSKYRIKYTLNDEENLMKDGIKCRVTFEQGTPNEFTLVDHV